MKERHLSLRKKCQGKERHQDQVKDQAKREKNKTISSDKSFKNQLRSYHSLVKHTKCYSIYPKMILHKKLILPCSMSFLLPLCESLGLFVNTSFKFKHYYYVILK